MNTQCTCRSTAGESSCRIDRVADLLSSQVVEQVERAVAVSADVVLREGFQVGTRRVVDLLELVAQNSVRGGPRDLLFGDGVECDDVTGDRF